MTERRDLFGRTEQELEAAIEHAERIYKVSSAYTGNEGLALALKAKRANIDVDRRMLAELRGQLRPDPARVLGGEALRKFRYEISRRGRAGIR